MSADLHPSLAESLDAAVRRAQEEQKAAVDTPPQADMEAATESDALKKDALREDTLGGKVPDEPAPNKAASNEDAPKGPTFGEDDLSPVVNGSPPPQGPPGAVSSEDDPDDEEGAEQDSVERSAMPLREHLRELRKRLIRVFLSALLGFILCWPVSQEIFDFLLIPMMKVMPAGSNFIYTGVPEAFLTYLKLAFTSGIFLASPLIFYQIWAFVAPGLYKEERAVVLPFAIISAALFICGGAFCFFMVFPVAFHFFMSFSTETIKAMPTIGNYLSFALNLLIPFGLVFELPLFVFFLARFGIVTAAAMRKKRRYAVVCVFIIAAVLTPPDVYSQILMAVPMLVLYELSIYVAAVFGKKKPDPQPQDDDSEYEDDEEDEIPSAPRP